MLGKSSKSATLDILTAVFVDASAISLARIARGKDSLPKITTWEYQPLRDETLPKALKRLSKSYRLNRKRCTTLLTPSSYRILLTNAPNVPEQERAQALRWVIKDMVDTPVNELTLQVFDFPETSNDKEKQIYVVAAKQEAVEDQIRRLRKSAIDLEVVDILEMAQRNIAELLPENARGTAIVTLIDDVCVITLCKMGTLYVTRRLDIPPDQWRQTPALVYERIALEVQRSLDYYNRHFRQTPIEHVYLTPAAIDQVGLLNYLAGLFPTPPRIIDFSELLPWTSAPPPVMPAPLAMAIGAALRNLQQGQAHAPAG